MKAPLITRALSALTLVALSACSGGSGGTPLAPIGVPTASGGATGQGKITITFKFPKAAASTTAATRRPDYLSLGTKSAVVTFNQGTTVTNQFVFPSINATTPGCVATGPAIICTTNQFAPVGTYAVSATTYDAVQTPSAVSNFQGKILSELAGLPVTVTAGTNTPVALTLGGLVQTGKVFLTNPSPAMKASTMPVQIFAYDADGFLIVGPYRSPITLTDSDATGVTTLQVNGGAAAATVQTGTSGDALALVYTGAALRLGATLTATTATTEQAAPPTFTTAAFAPTAATQLVYVGGNNVTGSNTSTLFVFDLGTKQQQAPNQFSVAAPLYNVGGSASPSFGLANQFTYNVNNGAFSITLFSEQVIPNPAPATPPSYQTPTATFTPPQNTGGNPIQLQNGDILTTDSFGNANAFSPVGEANVVNPTRSFTFGTFGTTVGRPTAVDGSGNLWTLCNVGLCEFAKADVETATGGATIQPITTIAGLPGGSGNDSIAFDASGNIYFDNGPNVAVYATTVRNSKGTPSPIEQFAATTPVQNDVYAGGIGVDPAAPVAGGTGGSIVLTEGFSQPQGGGGGRLDYFPGPGQPGAPTGGSTAPFQTITFPSVSVNGTGFLFLR